MHKSKLQLENLAIVEQCRDNKTNVSPSDNRSRATIDRHRQYHHDRFHLNIMIPLHRHQGFLEKEVADLGHQQGRVKIVYPDVDTSRLLALFPRSSLKIVLAGFRVQTITLSSSTIHSRDHWWPLALSSAPEVISSEGRLR